MGHDIRLRTKTKKKLELDYDSWVIPKGDDPDDDVIGEDEQVELFPIDEIPYPRKSHPFGMVGYDTLLYEQHRSSLLRERKAARGPLIHGERRKSKMEKKNMVGRDILELD